MIYIVLNEPINILQKIKFIFLNIIGIFSKISFIFRKIKGIFSKIIIGCK